jgi:hypothetical protein
MKFNVGDRVRITNPKSVAHYAVADMKVTGTIVSIDPQYYAKQKHTWASDVPQYIRNDRTPEGYFVKLDDNPSPAQPYRTSELAKL